MSKKSKKITYDPVKISISKIVKRTKHKTGETIWYQNKTVGWEIELMREDGSGTAFKTKNSVEILQTILAEL